MSPHELERTGRAVAEILGPEVKRVLVYPPMGTPGPTVIVRLIYAASSVEGVSEPVAVEISR